MTTVEFFDRTPVENIISTLTVVPDKIIFIGDRKLLQENRQAYYGFLAHRGLQTQLEFRNIKRNDLQDIIQVLSRIVETEEDCVFDLTGGEDLVLVAMGVVWERYRHKKVRIQRFNIRNGVVTDCDDDGKVLYEGQPALSVEEQILLHGGRVRFEQNGDGRTYPWDMTPDFIADIRLMWEQCRKNPGLWNGQINILSVLDDVASHPDPLLVEVELDSLSRYLAGRGMEEKDLSDLLEYFSDNGLITGYIRSNQILTFSYKNHQVRKALTNAGLTLELAVLGAAMTACHRDGQPYYSGAMNGVSIDWDGQFHRREDTQKDTENEMDVILMKGLVPVFISCKNGQVEEDELYKLDTVANRFGGQFVKKTMFVSYWNKKSSNPHYFRQRALDMGIDLVEDARQLSWEQLENCLRHTYHFSK